MTGGTFSLSVSVSLLNNVQVMLYVSKNNEETKVMVMVVDAGFRLFAWGRRGIHRRKKAVEHTVGRYVKKVREFYRSCQYVDG